MQDEEDTEEPDCSSDYSSDEVEDQKQAYMNLLNQVIQKEN